MATFREIEGKGRNVYDPSPKGLSINNACIPHLFLLIHVHEIFIRISIHHNLWTIQVKELESKMKEQQHSDSLILQQKVFSLPIIQGKKKMLSLSTCAHELHYFCSYRLRNWRTKSRNNCAPSPWLNRRYFLANIKEFFKQSSQH